LEVFYPLILIDYFDFCRNPQKDRTTLFWGIPRLRWGCITCNAKSG
jgi:hypothetical protein